MISIVTGTLNRKHLLPEVIENTVNNNEKVELILVDGGSTDGTITYLKDLSHPRIKLIEVGHRSSYPHFMNLGIRNASYDWICQWNDDALLTCSWYEVINEIKGNPQIDVFIFPWKKDTDKDWITYCDFKEEVCMNYGLYNRDIFRKIGMYNNEYKYYCADGDMSFRAWIFGYNVKIPHNIKVIIPANEQKRAIGYGDEMDLYIEKRKLYRQKILPDNLEYL